MTVTNENPGYYTKDALFVGYDGTLLGYYFFVNGGIDGARSAFWDTIPLACEWRKCP